MLRRTIGVSLILVSFFAVWFNINSLSEAFGSGPPYYSRTTNMDKWENPLPMIMMVDAVVCIALAAFFVSKKRAK